jgi:hypothetical protein
MLLHSTPFGAKGRSIKPKPRDAKRTSTSGGVAGIESQVLDIALEGKKGGDVDGEEERERG